MNDPSPQTRVASSPAQSFGLGDSQFTDESLALLAHLSHVISLDLKGTPITDDGLSHVATLTNLGRLNLNGMSTIGDLGVEKLATLKKLYGIALWHTRATDHSLKTLKGLHCLSSIVVGVAREKRGVRNNRLPVLEVVAVPPMAARLAWTPPDVLILNVEAAEQ